MVLFKLYKPTNPVFDDYVSRLATFDGWGDDVKQTPDMLAEAGFFFIGMSTKIIGKCQKKKKKKRINKTNEEIQYLLGFIGIHHHT